MLAGLICSPNRFSPARHPEQAVAERDTVLERMLHEHMITPAQVAAAKALRVETMSRPAFHTEDDYVTDAVIRGVAEVLDPDVIERGGLRVTITIDRQLQKLAEAAADRRLTEIESHRLDTRNWADRWLTAVITERSGYVLQGADAHLELAKLALGRGDKAAAKEHAQSARSLATCDGPPDYTYKAAYHEAGALLQQLA